MNTAVVFTDNGARIFQGINPQDFTGTPNVLINPEFPLGIPPHYWKMSDGKIAIMTDEEKRAMDRRLNNELLNREIHVTSFKFTHEHFKIMQDFCNACATAKAIRVSCVTTTVLIVFETLLKYFFKL